MKKLIILSLVLILSQVALTHAGSLDAPAKKNIQSDVVYRAYAENPMAADKLYLGQVYTIVGKIEAISANENLHVELAHPYIGQGTNIYGYRCIFSDSRELEKLKTGNNISLTGIIDGLRGIGYLMVKDCRLTR